MLGDGANDVALQAKKAKGVNVDLIKPLAAAAAKALRDCCAPLGLMLAEPETYAARCRKRRLTIKNLDAASIDTKVAARTEARANKDFAKGDEIRKELTELGIELLDNPSGTSWRVLV